MAGVRPKQCGFDPNLADARLRKRNSTNLSTWSNWASDSMAWTLISATGGLRTGTKRGKRGVSRHRQADAAGSVLENQLVSGVVHITKEQAAARRIFRIFALAPAPLSWAWDDSQRMLLGWAKKDAHTLFTFHFWTERRRHLARRRRGLLLRNALRRWCTPKVVQWGARAWCVTANNFLYSFHTRREIPAASSDASECTLGLFFGWRARLSVCLCLARDTIRTYRT